MQKKVLQFFSKVSGNNPTSFVSLYREALRDEEERAQLAMATQGDPPADSSTTAKSSGFSCPK
jgi:hypothetical protein